MALSTRQAALRRGLLVVAGLAGLVGFLLQYGFRGPTDQMVWPNLLSALAVLLFTAELTLAAVWVRPWRAFFTSHWLALVLIVFLLGELLVVRFGGGSWLAPFLHFFSVRSVTQAYVVVAQFYILSNVLLHLPRLNTGLAKLRIRPGAAFVIVFLLLILAGTGLLSLPRALPEGQKISFLDALFTSTSAVCVTGLIVRDTATQFTPVGQAILLLLIQLGGLGIMSVAATLSLMLGRGIGIREGSLLREVFQLPVLTEIGRVLRFIVLFTFVTELVGTACLYVGFQDMIADPRHRLFQALFHAVSAFCNSGFSTFSDSLVTMSHLPWVVGPIAVLLILGGLGFAVVINLQVYLRGLATRSRTQPGPRLMVQTKVVLALTAVLLLGGTLVLAGLEWDAAFGDRSVVQKVGLAFFQSATTRTAGFNSVDLTLMSVPSLFLMILLMFVGGASGSTAGGVKLSTVAIMWANLRAIGQGLPQARLWGREISATAFRRSVVVLAGALVFAALGTFLLLVTEGRSLLITAFEAFSALGTVGLSLGLTPELSPPGRVVVVILMFVGRLGPLTLAYGLVPPSRERRVRLPQARLLVG